MGGQGQLNKPSRRSTLALLGAVAFGHRIQPSWGQTSPSLPVLRVAIISRTVFYAPLWAALALKLFEREGLSVTLSVFDNAERITEALLKGEIDIAVSTPESVMVDAYQGGPLRMVAGNAEKLPHQIIARPPVQSTQDLVGARFGVLSLKEGTAYLVKRYAESIGLNKDQYTVVAVGGAPTRWKHLQDGSIDVGFQPFPLSYVAEDAGYKNLGAISGLFPDWLFTSVNVHQRWAQQHAQSLKIFLATLNAAQLQFMATPHAFDALLAQELRTTPAYAARAIDQAVRMNMFAPGTRVHPPAAKAVFEALLDTEQLPVGTPFQMERFFDASYL